MLKPRNFFYTQTQAQCIYGCDTSVGSIVVHDSLDSIAINCNNIQVDNIKGHASYHNSQLAFNGTYYNTQIHLSASFAHKQRALICNFLSTVAGKRFQGNISVIGNDTTACLSCKCIDPGIRDLYFNASGTWPNTLEGNFSGTFYNNKFSGVIHGYSHSGSGILKCDLLPPTKLVWQNTTLYLNSSLGHGSIDLVTRDGMLYFYNHTVDINHDQIHITGPEVCMSLYNRKADTKIAGPSMIYAGDLIKAIVWMESFKDYRGKSAYRVICNNFQTHGMQARVYGDPNRVQATFANRCSRLDVRRLNNNLSIYCSDICKFEQLIGKFAITSGRVWIQALKRNKVWQGRFSIKNAQVLQEYQSRLQGIDQTWGVSGKWSFDGRKLKIRADAHNKDAYLKLDIHLDRFHGRKRIMLRGSLYKRNKIINALALIASRQKMHTIFGSRFYAAGYADSPVFATSKANVLLGWVSFLPL
jgi:hypothetical protein